MTITEIKRELNQIQAKLQEIAARDLWEARENQVRFFEAREKELKAELEAFKI